LTQEAIGLDRDVSATSRLARHLAQARADLSFAAIDAVLIVAAYMMALVVRSFDGLMDDRYWTSVLVAMPVIVLIHLAANVVMGAYGHMWEYASISEARRVILACAISSGILLPLQFALGIEPREVPLSVIVLGGLLTLCFLGAVRFRSRLFSFQRALQFEATDRALILGTDKRSADLARDTSQSPYGVSVLGFVSPEHAPEKRRLAGLPILGELNDIASLVERYEVNEVIVAAEGASSLARQLVDLCVDVDVRLRIVPALDDVLKGNEGGPDIRDLELDDLLARPRVNTDLAFVASSLEGKVVMVTGAGGSIGSEIVAQVLRFSPRVLIAMDHDETHLHDGTLQWEVGEDTELIPALADLRELEQLRRLVNVHKPEVVFHAAAHKHVPILEEWPEEAVKTNVIGTANLLDALTGTPLERFILISTDKTVNPSSVMGASKRVAEMLVQSAARASDGSCAFSSVRFGNVLGSRGSVVPTFMEQIRKGGPVTITDDRMTRYFMTIDEAVELVLQAGAMAHTGEVFVLDMGEPVRILDLAHRMIRLAGLVPGRDIEVQSTGVRPGEKLTEQLTHGVLTASPHPMINVTQAPYPGPATLDELTAQLGILADGEHTSDLRQWLVDAANMEWPRDEVIDLTESTPEVLEWT
jgi:FlaA1/EpsC-like NDP-sugar epimerase